MNLEQKMTQTIIKPVFVTVQFNALYVNTFDPVLNSIFAYFIF